MSIERVTTQSIHLPGSPKADELGLTLRERMWLARAALATIVLSALSCCLLVTLIPSERPQPTSPMATELAQRALRPQLSELAPMPLPPLALPPLALPPRPAPEEQPEVQQAPMMSEPAPIASSSSSSKPSRRVVITRGKIAAQSLPHVPAVDLSRPQPLAPPRRSEPPPVSAEPESRPEPPVLARPTEELKRPAFE